jgi:phenylacetate-CoA ligase
MSCYQSFVKHVSFPLIARRDGLAGIKDRLRFLEESQHWSRERIREYQLARLKDMLVHAYANTDFYHKRFDEAGFNPQTFKSFDELKKLPTLSKKDIRENLSSLVAGNFKSGELHAAETGGTTGVKMKFFRDNVCLSPKEAALYRFEKWAGWNFGEKMGIVWTAQQDYVGHWTMKSKIKNALFLRQVVFPAAIIDERSMKDYVAKLVQAKPTMIRAFVSPIYELAQYMNDVGIDYVKLRGVITTGEPLYEHQRKVISKAFHCGVFDSYRSRETGPLAQECEVHSGMHINAESLYVETVDTGEFRHSEDKAGKIVVTDLLNFGMPLIRYEMGDIGCISDEVCSCGRGLPLIKNIEGRTADILFTPDGKRITAGSLVLYLVDEAPGLVGQIQVIQDKINHVVIRATKDPSLSENIRDYHIMTVKRLFGDTMQVSFEEVDRIEIESSGKYRFTVCQISE